MNIRSEMSLRRISSGIGRPVRLLSSVCEEAPGFRPDVLRECAAIVRKYNGSALAAVHPGYYLQDREKTKVIAGIRTREARAEMGVRYEAYCSRLEKLLSRSRMPLLLFAEAHKKLDRNDRVFEFSRSDLILVISTVKQSPVPVISAEIPDVDRSWMLAASTVRFALGIKKVQFAGEYMFINHGCRSGCVDGAYVALNGLVAGEVDLNFTFPNSSRITRPFSLE